MIEVYRGTPNAWECDEMGHMNVRFYLAKLMEGVGVFCYHAVMPNAFRTNAPSTVQLKDLHIRFVKEAHAGAPVYMTAGALEVAESSALIYVQVNHLDGEPCAAFRFRMDHIDIHTRQPFLWSPKTIEALKSLTAETIEVTAPRSIDFNATSNPPPTMETASEMGCLQIGTGLVLPEQCDVFGNMKTDFFIGRVSDSAPHLIDSTGKGLSRSPSPDQEGQRIGTAALEYRFIFHNRPIAGDTFVVYGGLGEIASKTFGLFYWLMDPHTNTAYATVQATLVQFDLDTRKAVPLPSEAVTALKKNVPGGMWL